jgi:zinc transport system substrate-binding protein
MKRAVIIIVMAIAAMTAVVLAGCTREELKPSSKLQVVTTLFPLYDFARTVAGDRADVTMLLPPGMEPHSFEPKPNDIIRVGKAGLFIYTNPYMEPWAETIIKGVDNPKLRVVNAGQGVSYLKSAADDDHDGQGMHQHGKLGEGMDPHIWLDFANDFLIVDNILAGFLSADPVNSDLYRGNAAALKSRLANLERRYQDGLSNCSTRVFLHGGHYTFGYLARRYNLEYRSLSGMSSESEPSASRMADMVRRIRSSGVSFLFAEELLSPRLTETLANEAGVANLRLHGAHNLGRDDFQSGIDFISLMDQNLVNLRKGLACQPK